MGYRRLPSPDEFPTACWFEAPDGTQIHLSQDPDHRPAARAHVAVVVDDVTALRSHLAQLDQPHEVVERPDITVVLCTDPAGNRWELRSRA